jgi:ribosomal protein S18 acetylase RimI-like enzyme
VSDEENARRGRPEVYVDRVGTRRAYRRSRIASHLVVLTLQASAAAGMESAALDVDETSHTEATLVYRRLGFEVTERSTTYLKTMESAPT